MHRYRVSIISLAILGVALLASQPVCAVTITVNSSRNWSTISPAPSAADTILVNNGATLTVDVSTAVCGNIQLGQAGGGDAGTGVLFFNSGSVVACAGDVTVGVTSTRNGTINMVNGGTLKIGGVLTFTAGASALSPGSGTAATIEFNGAGNQTIPAPNATYNHVVTSGGGTKTLGGSITNAGNMTIGAGTTLDVSASNYSLTVRGTWNNQGTFNARSGGVTLSGSGAQSLFGATTFNNLTNNNGGLTLNASVTVNSTLNLVAGSITTGGNTLSLGAGGTILNATSSRYIYGNLQKTFNAGSGQSFTFPIGDVFYYAPVALASMTVSSAGTLTVTTTAGEHPNISASGLNSGRSVNRYWSLTAGGGLAASTYNATFNFVSTDVDFGATTAAFVVRRYSGGSWFATTTGTRTATSAQATGLSAFSDFAVGEQLISHYAVSASSPQTAGAAFLTTVTAQDLLNQTVVADSSTVVTLSSSTGNAQFDSDGNGTFGDNTKTLSAGAFTISTKDNVAETVDVIATDANSKTGTRSGLVVNPAAAATLAFVQQPTDSGLNATITPAVTVRVRDAFNNNVPGVSVSITLSSGSGALSGTTTRTTDSAGIATFNDLSLNQPGPKTLQASSGVLTPVVSSSFTVAVGEPAQLAFTQQPTLTTAGQPITPAVQVQVQDQFGNNVSASGVSVAIGLQSGSGLLSGTLTRTTDANGVATFDGLSINLASTKTLRATGSGLTEAVSAAFTIRPAAASALVIQSAYPSSTVAGESHSWTLRLEDSFGNTATGYVGTVHFSSSDPQAVRPADYTFTAGNAGVQSFNLALRTAGTQSLTATDTGSGALTVTQSGISVTPAAASKLGVQTQPPATAVAGVAFAPQPGVRIEDAYGNLVSSDNTTVVTAARAAGTGDLQGTLTATASGGLAGFANLSHNVANTITIGFSASGLTGATSTSIEVGPAAASQLVFSTQPGGAVYGSALSPEPVVKSRDAFGNDSAVGLGASKTVTLTLSAGSGALQGTTSLDIGTGATTPGVASFTDLKVSAAGAGKVLTASADSLTSTQSVAFTIATATVTPSVTADSKVYDGGTAATIASRSLTGVIGSDDVSLTGGAASFVTKTVGNGKTVNVTGLSLTGAHAGNYQLSSTSASTTANITPATVTGSITADNKDYDGGTAATILTRSLSGAVDGDAVSLTGGTAIFADKSVGTGKTVTATGLGLSGADAGNYQLASSTLTATADITPRSLTVTATGVNREYDGTTAATVTLADNRVSGDDVTTSYTSASFADKNVGTGKSVSVSGIAITGGADAGNYTANTTATTTANITTWAITVTAVTDSKTYDGTASSAGAPTITSGSLASGDSATWTQTFDNRNVGTGKTLTPAGAVNDGNSGGNYTVTFANTTTGVITARAITVTAATDTKTYDGTTSSTGTPTITSGSLASGDSATWTQSFANRNAGTGKTLTPAGSVSDGNGGNNYAVTLAPVTTGVITTRPITVTAVTSTKGYDGSNSSAGVPTVTGGLGTGDTAGFTQTFDTKHVGAGKTLTPAGSVSDGNSGNNYAVTFVNDTAGVITARAITVAAVTATKTYDGGTSSTGTPTITPALVSGDTATSLSQAFQTKHAGAGNKVLVPAITINDGNGGNNYTVTLQNFTAGTINPLAITVAAVTDTKTYDGGTSSTGTPTITPPLVGGDTATSLSQAFQTKHAGAGNKVLVPAITLNDGNGGNNYTVTLQNFTTGTIQPLVVTVTAVAASKDYDGTTTSDGVPDIAPALVGDDTSGFSQSYDTRHAGTGKTLTPAGAANDGSGGNNYAVTFAPVTTGEIRKRAITVTAATDTKVYDGTTSSGGVPTITSGSLASGDSVTWTQAFATKDVGTGKTLLPAGTVSDGNSGANYTVTFANNTTGVISEKTLTVTADNKSRAAGEANPTFTATYSGFVAGETLPTSGVTGEPAFSTTAGNVAGDYPITISVGTLAADNYSFSFVPGTLTVTPATASQLVFTSAPVTVTAGVASSSITVQRQDAYGNPNTTDATRTVTLASSSSGTVTFNPASLTIASGSSSASFTYTDTQAGTPTITASSTSPTTITPATQVETVTGATFTKLQVLVPGETAAPGTPTGKTGTPSPQTAGTSFNVTVRAVDANWNLVSTATDTIAVTSSDPNDTHPGNVALSGGVATRSVTFTTAGSWTVTASDVTDPGKTANTSPAITVNPGAFAKLQLLVPGETAAPGTASGKTGTPSAQTSFSAVSLTVNAVDANWNLVNTATDTVGITSSDTRATLPANAALVAGTTNFTFYFGTNGSFTLTATDLSDGSKTANTSPNITVAAAQFTAATGGGAISADNAVTTTWTTLTGPVYTEATGANITLGTIILNAPAGFGFDTGGTAPTVRITSGGPGSKNINSVSSGTAVAMSSVTSTALTFTVTAASTLGTPNTLTWQNVRVRPTAGTPLATGNIWVSGTATVPSVSTNSNFGTLREVAGAANKLVIQTQPSATAVAGVAFAQQPVILVQDQFGTLRSAANGAADNSTVVTATRSAGSGILQGTTNRMAANGVVTFTDLSHQVAGTITIAFSGPANGATSGNVVVSPAVASQLAFSTQPGGVAYGEVLSLQPVVKTRDPFGNDSTVGLPSSLMVTLALTAGTGALQGTASLDIGTGVGNGTVTFSDLKVNAAGAGKQLTASASGLASAVSSTFTITPRTVYPSITAHGKVYDGTTAATIATYSLSGMVPGDDVVLANGTATFADKNVGNGKTVTATGMILSGADAPNYQLSTTTVTTTANITPRSLTVSATGVNKTYDGTTTASVTLLDNRVSGDVLTTSYTSASFADQHVGTAKAVSVSGIAVSGADAGNYTLANTTDDTTADITTRPITVTAVSDTKGYDGNTSSTGVPTITSGSLASGDSVTWTQSFDTKHVGTGKTLAPAGTVTDGNGGANYTVTFVNTTTGAITARPLTVTAVTDTKGYDGTTSSTGTPTISTGSLAAGDSATWAQSFDSKHVGTGKTLIPTGTVSDENAGQNYAVTFVNNTTGEITVRAITVTAATDTKVYDGTTGSDGVPTLTSGSLASGDSVTWTQSFDTKHVGTGKNLTPAGTVSDGNGGNNYAVTFVNDTTGEITTRPITVTAQPDSKTYDGTTSSAAMPTITGGLGSGDTANFSQTFDTKHVGTGKTLTPSGAVSDGNGGANYAVTFVSVHSGEIAARPITVTAVPQTKVYDGTMNSTATPTITSGSLASGDTATWTQTFDTKHVGTGKTLTPAGTVTDGNGGANYTVTFVNTTTGAITARAITVTAVSDSKGYDGTTSSAGTPTITAGSLAAGDSATWAQSFDTKHVGTGKTLIPTGTVSDENAGQNYAVTFVNNTTGAITVRAITVTAATDTKVYDGTTSSDGVPTLTSGSLAGGDSVTWTQTFDTKNVGTGKTLTPAGTVTDGNGGNNYAVTFVNDTTGVITTRAITVTAATDSKTYDGTTSSAGVPTITSGSLGSGDSATWTQTFDTKHVGTGKTLTPSGSVSDGNSGNNYAVTFVNDPTGVITKKTLTVTADDKSRAAGEAYPTFTASFSGFVSGETLPTSGVTGEPEFSTTAGNVAGTYPITVTVGTLAADNYSFSFVNGTLTVTPAAASRLVFITSAQTFTAGATSGTLTVQRRDAYGNTNTADATITVDLSSDSTGDHAFRNTADTATITSVTISSGSSSASFRYRDALVGTPTLTASATGLASAQQMQTITAGAATKLQVLLPGETAAPGTPTGKTGTPSAHTAGSAILNGVVVRAVDANWNLVASANHNVTLTSSDAYAAIADDNGGSAGHLTLSSGTATLSSFTFKAAGTRTITASASGLTSGTSGDVTVNPGAFAKLQLLVPGETAVPGSATGKTGTPASQVAFNAVPLTVNAVDANWNLVSTVSDTVGITCTDASAVLPASAALVAGTGGFTNYFGATGTFTLTATDVTDGSKTASTSPNIIVSAAPYTLATGGAAISADTTGDGWTTLTGPVYIEVNSGDVGTGTIILNAPAGFIFDTAAPTPSVSSVKDGGSGNTPVTISFTSVTAGQIVFTVTAPSSSTRSRLTWSNLRVRPSAGTPLASGIIARSGTASVAGLGANANLGILREVPGVPAQLAIQTQPSATATAGVAFGQQPVLRLHDQFGNLCTNSSAVVTATRNAGSGPLQGTTSRAALNGIATFTNLSHNVATTITIDFNTAGAATETSSAIVISPAAASQLVFTTQPGGVVYGSLLSPQPVLKSRDAFGNDSTVGLGASKMVTLALIAGTGALQGTTALDIGTGAGNGTVSFTDLQVSAAGTGKQITATASDLASAVSTSFTITPATVVPSITADNKVYDGTTAATIATRSLSGVLGDDDVVLTGGTATFNNKNVGTGKPVTATGLTLSGTAAGNYQLSSTTAATTADITARGLTVSATGVNKTYDGTATATVTLSDNRVSGDVLTTSYASASFADKAVGTAKLVSVSGIAIGGTDAGNYALASTTANTTANITAKNLTVTGITANHKVYDATTAATLNVGSAALAGVVSGDDVSLNTAGATGAFTTKTVGTNKTVTVSGLALSGADAGNYSLTQPAATANISSRPLTVTGITANNKVYDGNTNATLVKTGAALVGVVSGDVVNLATNAATGLFVDKNVGIGKLVTISGCAISGADAGNYSLTQPTTTADITPKTLTISGITAQNKVYDGSTVATLNKTSAALVGKVTGDVVNLATNAATGTFADKNVGTGKLVTVSGCTISGTDAGNYTLVQPTPTANITAKGLTVTGITADNKVYDGNTSATLNIGSATLVGVVSGDTVSLNTGSATGTFANKDVGAAKTVTVSGLTISGLDAGNYTLTQPTTTAAITPATVTGSITAGNKVYDGTAAATILSSSLSGVIGGDLVSLTGGTATFADKHVGSGKLVTATGLSLTGAQAGNYQLASTTATTTANISARPLTITATAENKVYDQTTAATVTLEDNRVSGDNFTLSFVSATFANKDVGTGKTVTVSGITLLGPDSGNYSFTATALTTANITARPLTVSGITAIHKVYDGSTSATLDTSGASLNGVLSPDDVTLNTGSASGAFADKQVGTGKTVTVSGLTLNGADAGNYTLTPPAPTASITAKALTVAGASAHNKVYDGTTTATLDLTGATLMGVVEEDDVTLVTSGATGAFADADAGEGKSVTVSGLSLGGADAGNYSLTPPALTADITPAATAVAVVASANPALSGAEVTFTATVSVLAPGAGEPTGTIQFRTNGVAAGAPVALSAGVATFATAVLRHGTNTVVAEYAGGGNFTNSTGILTPPLIVNTPPAAGNDMILRNPALSVKVPVATLLANDSDADEDVLSIVTVSATSEHGGIVQLASGRVFYTPALGYTGADSFTYTVGDGYGGTAEGTVIVAIENDPSQSANILSVEVLGGGAVRIRFAGIPGYTYSIQATETLGGGWTTIGTAGPPLGGNGSFEFTDEDAPNHATRYYRTKFP